MRVSISSVVLAAAIAFAEPASATIAVTITRPLGTPLIKKELVRGNLYYASSVGVCRVVTAPPQIRFNGVDIGTTGCHSIGHAAFRVRADAPIARGSLSVTQGTLALPVEGLFDVVAPPPPPPPPVPPALSVSPVQLSFTANTSGGHVPPDRQTFEIRNTGGGTLTWTISENLRWLIVVANEQCAVPAGCPSCGVICSGGNKGSVGGGAASISGSGNAIIGVQAPGWTLPSGATTTGTISIATNAGNVSVTVTVTTPANLEFDCYNHSDDDGDGAADSNDNNCSPNPFAGF